ncbi:putative pentatricopeptide repeat-containing protein [Ananas comosus]|uniref:Putative pentatricopeptide repeat-containing protein n=1 Tax=Ananas comosus TaxID=4615 RepID=A0A199UNW2_ANACO|nr:putative pentatricopeptide repeat-containing protein [Ananas comosus]
MRRLDVVVREAEALVGGFCAAAGGGAAPTEKNTRGAGAGAGCASASPSCALSLGLPFFFFAVVFFSASSPTPFAAAAAAAATGSGWGPADVPARPGRRPPLAVGGARPPAGPAAPRPPPQVGPRALVVPFLPALPPLQPPHHLLRPLLPPPPLPPRLPRPPRRRPAPAASWCALLSSLAQNALPLLALSVFRSMLRAGVPPPTAPPSAAKSAAALSSLARPLPPRLASSPLLPDVFVSSSSSTCTPSAPSSPTPSASSISCPPATSSPGPPSSPPTPPTRPSTPPRSPSSGPRSSRASTSTTSPSPPSPASAPPPPPRARAQVHARAAKSGLDASPFVGSALVSLYSKCGLAAHADQVFDEMPRRNLGAWNAALAAAAQHGRAADAFRRFEAMRAAGSAQLHHLPLPAHRVQPRGLVGEGRRYFASCPSTASSRARALRRDATESVWSALLTACRIHKDTGTAALAADRLFAAGSLSSGASMLLRRVRRGRRYADAARARKEMRDRGVRKETGLSWLEAGGRCTPGGYVADTSEVGRDVGGEEKRAAVRYHSERLAIGLGLLVVPEGVPIRVMKNLRVCSDCHTAIKYLSKCTGRTVVLRDNHRFHRFESGQCSCRDFW